jgi:hypothetical protein
LKEFLTKATYAVARSGGWDPAERKVSALVGADHIGLAMAAASFRAKRAQRRSRRSLIRACLDLLVACRRRPAPADAQRCTP